MSDADAIVDRRRLRGRLSFWRTAAILVAGAAVAFALYAAAGDRLGGLTGAGHIARFEVSGMITGPKSQLDTLEKIAEDDNVKGLIVTINSPGGTTSGSEALYLALRKIAEKKPVVAVVGTMAASGGYIVALATDHIVTRRTSMVGSIGVLMQWPQVSELMKSWGVQINEVKSSPLKAAPNMFEPPSPEALAVLESLVQDSYNWFLGLVSERRKFSPEEARQVGDGRVYTGGQALPLKLIDEIGDEKTAVAWMAANRNIDSKLPIKTWSPDSDLFSTDLATHAMAWGLRKVGLDALADLFAPGGAFNRTGTLDGLLSLWQAPGAAPGSGALKAVP